MPVGSATCEAVPNEAVGAVDTAWGGAHAGGLAHLRPVGGSAAANGRTVAETMPDE